MNLIIIFVLFNKYFKWHFCFLNSINVSISLCYNCKHSTHFPMHNEGARLQKVQYIESPEFSPATNTVQIHVWEP